MNLRSHMLDMVALKARKHLAESTDYLRRAVEIFDRLGTMVEPERVRVQLAGLNEAASTIRC
jgi:hypothetical protein